MAKNFLFIIFNILLISNSYSTIIIPLESFQSKLEEDSESNSESLTLIEQLFNMNLVATIKIGSKAYPLKGFFNANSPFLYISKNCFIDESSSFNYKINFNYNRYQSESFYNTSFFDISFGTSFHACTATETFLFKTHDKAEIKTEKINFILSEDTSEKQPNCLHIGLIENQNKESSFTDMNLVLQLKQKNYIKGNIWSIIYNKESNNNNLLNNADELLNLKGNMIIGDYLHNYDSKNFFESQFKHIYTIYNENIMKWELKFNKIYFKNKENKEEKINDYNAVLNPSNYLIYAPKEYFETILDKYFLEYINDDICFQYSLDEYISVYCEKSNKFSIHELKSFPTIYFDHINLEYTFELTYEDLFIEKDNIYWFLIVSDTMYYQNGWTLGNIFLKKYQFSFNLETKEIGFYNTNLEKIKNKNNNMGERNSILYIIIIVALIIILFGIGFLIKIKFFTKTYKKKRANELDDDYEYIMDKNNDNKNADSINDDNKLFNNS